MSRALAVVRTGMLAFMMADGGIVGSDLRRVARAPASQTGVEVERRPSSVAICGGLWRKALSPISMVVRDTVTPPY